MINKELYKFCGKTRKYIVYGVIASCFKLFSSIAFSYSFAYLLSKVLYKESINLVIFMVITIAILGKFIATNLISMFNTKIVAEVKFNLREAIYNKVLRLGISYRESLTTQETIHLAVEGVEQLETYYGGYLTQFYYCFSSSIILFFAILPINKQAALILLIASPIIPLTLQLIMKIVRSSQRKYWKKYADVGNLFLDSLSGLTTLKIFKADKKRANDMDIQAEAFRKQTMKLLGMQLNSITVIDLIAYGSAALVVVLTIYEGISYHTINPIKILLLIMLSADFFVPMKSLTSLFHVAMTGVSAGESILNFLKEPEVINCGSECFPKEASIQIKDLYFTYPDKTEAVKGVNMLFSRNKLTAIIGKSGCGKSTLAGIISGQLNEQSNSMSYITDVKEIKSSQLLEGEIVKNVVKIGHEPYIFASNVKENIRMLNTKVKDEEIVDILKKMKMWEFLEEQQGLDTKLLANGKNLSGGQMQRIAIARAIIGDFKVYIFDESTSGVDIESEAIILNMIKELAKVKTVIYISHKMNVIKSAQHVYVMDDGKLVEEGNHSTLMQNKNLYYKLYSEQEELSKYNSLVTGGNV